jgi:hypothetical protein
MVEVRNRKTGEKFEVKVEEVVDKIKELFWFIF